MKKKTQSHLHHNHHQNQNRNNNNNNNNFVFNLSKRFIFCHHPNLRSHLLSIVSAIVGCVLFHLSLVSFLSPPINHHSVHRSHFNHSLIDNEIDFQSHIGNTSTFVVPRGGSLEDGIWRSCESNIYYGCSQKSKTFQDADQKTNPVRFLMINTSGGLNQQRTGIIDAVVAAYILNSTLVVPKLDNVSYWKDQSNFSNIYDVDWFISYPSKDVSIIKELATSAYQMRVPRKCDLECYESRVLPLLEMKKVIMLTKFDYRLSNNLDKDLQNLRCRVNYPAHFLTEPGLARLIARWLLGSWLNILSTSGQKCYHIVSNLNAVLADSSLSLTNHMKLLANIPDRKESYTQLQHHP
ncbi:hypothetical protein R6Q57_029715 [Mikania cordata]